MARRGLALEVGHAHVGEVHVAVAGGLDDHDALVHRGPDRVPDGPDALDRPVRGPAPLDVHDRLELDEHDVAPAELLRRRADGRRRVVGAGGVLGVGREGRDRADVGIRHGRPLTPCPSARRRGRRAPPCRGPRAVRRVEPCSAAGREPERRELDVGAAPLVLDVGDVTRRPSGRRRCPWRRGSPGSRQVGDAAGRAYLGPAGRRRGGPAVAGGGAATGGGHRLAGDGASPRRRTRPRPPARRGGVRQHGPRMAVDRAFGPPKDAFHPDSGGPGRTRARAGRALRHGRRGPVFALTGLPEVVKGALFARYSRSPKSLRRLLLDEFLPPETGAAARAPARAWDASAPRPSTTGCWPSTATTRSPSSAAPTSRWRARRTS